MANTPNIQDLENFENRSYIEYKITQNNELSVTSFLNNNEALINGISRSQFLSFKGNTDKSNLDRIYDVYTWDGQKQINKTSYSTGNLETINKGTILLIPISKIDEELVQINGKNLYLKQEKGQNVYYSEKLQELQNEPFYVKKEQVTKEGRNIDIQLIEENCQVWIYSKSLEKIINVSPFVTFTSTNKGDVGSFNIQLNPIVDEKMFLNNSKSEYLSFFDINENSEDYFTKHLQYNDVVFIRFEKLELEGDNDNIYDFEINKSKLPNQIFDMIGLVDNINTNLNTATTDYSISISGRDLMKVLIEDGNYFMPFRYMSGNSYQFFYADPNSKQGKRNFYNGAYEFLFTYSFRSIKSTFAFIMNFCANLGVVGDYDLFSAYKDRRTEVYTKEIETQDISYLKSNKVNGIWQIIKLSVDEKVDDRRIADPSIGNTDSTLIEQMNKVCQKPFVEFFGDTYGSQYEFIVRQPPWDRDSILDCIKKGLVIDIEDKDIIGNINLNWETEFYSWFQVQPDNIFAGNNKWAFASYLPIVFLDEFAEYFGNHRKIIQDIYVSEQALSGIKGDENLDLFKRAVLNDLKYLIDSHVYLPFTRKGSFTINGDRRIKKGMWVRLKRTGELCYVDSVSNNCRFNNSMVDRTTTLQVSRCMVEDCILGKPVFESLEETGEEVFKTITTFVKDSNNLKVELGITPLRYSYFHIVNTALIYNTLIQRIENPIKIDANYSKPKEQISTNFGVNKEIFDFFLKRKQFKQ